MLRAVLALLAVAAAGAAFVVARDRIETVPSRAVLIGAPLRAATAEGDRIYLLTGQWRTLLRSNRFRARDYTTRYHLDLWAFEAASATPAWRRRLHTVRTGDPMAERGVLGLADGVLRVELPGGPAAVRAADGAPMPLPATALPALPPTAQPTFSPAFHSRAVVQPERWVGLLSEREAGTFAPAGGVDALGLNLDAQTRLFAATVHEERAGNGWMRRRHAPPVPLGEGPPFRGASLLTLPGQEAPLRLAGPDSVLVLHREPVGGTFRLRLARLALADGRRLWDAALPLDGLRAVLPPAAAGPLLLYGQRTPAEPEGYGVEAGNPIELLVAVDPAGGGIRPFAFYLPAPDDD